MFFERGCQIVNQPQQDPVLVGEPVGGLDAAIQVSVNKTDYRARVTIATMQRMRPRESELESQALCSGFVSFSKFYVIQSPCTLHCICLFYVDYSYIVLPTPCNCLVFVSDYHMQVIHFVLQSSFWSRDVHTSFFSQSKSGLKSLRADQVFCNNSD